MVFSDVISLETESRTIVAFSSESGAFILCPAGIDKCIDEYSTPTKQEGTNKLVTHSTFISTRYVIEFNKNSFIYRIQDKSCFIEYPHGCLIHGFGWDDLYTYEFKR